MVIIDKIFAGSLITSSLVALTMSIAPQQAQSQAFKLGQSQTNVPGVVNATNGRGQAFNFTVRGGTGLGNLSSTTRPFATIQSIKFALITTDLVTPTSGLVAYLYNLTTGGLPTTAALDGGGIGSIATSAQATSITADGEFTAIPLTSLVFNFASTPELATTDTYGIFLSRGSDFITGPTTDGRDALRGSTANTYAGAGLVAYRDAAGSPVPESATFTDAAFIVSATAVPFEFEASGGVAILGGLFLFNKFKNRKKTEKVDEQV